MRLQRQAHGLVIRHHLFADGHHGQGHRDLCPFVAAVPEQRQVGGVAQGLRLPQRLAAVDPHGPHGIRLCKAAHHGGTQPGAGLERLKVVIRCIAGGHDPRRGLGPQPADLAQAQPHGPGAAIGFQRVVPVGEVHVRRLHGHVVVLRVAHDLRRGVEPHRLGIQQRGAEGGGVMALQPARDIDQLRKARRVGFRKAVVAETLDLVETPRGEVLVIAARDHAADHLLFQQFDRAARPEGRHRLAQLVRLRPGKLRRVDGDLHRLFLKDRHAEGAAEDFFQLLRVVRFAGGWVAHRLLARPAAQVGMHHVALDRAGTDDGDFDHEVIEGARPQARQHVDLGAGFHLKDADAVALAEHRIDARILLRDGGQRPVVAVMRPDQVEAFADAGQHPQRQDIDLEDAKRVDVVLVPFDEGPVRHRPVADRHGAGQRPFGQDEAADVLAQMARHADHLPRDDQGAAQQGVGQVDAGLLRVAFADVGAPAAPDGLGEGGRHILGQAHDLSDLADRAARAVVDHGGAKARAMAAILFVDVLNHLLAPLVFEIDVDVGRLLAFLGDEAFEQQRVLGGIDGSDAKDVTDGRVGRRPAPLAQDAARPGEQDDVVDRQEILRDVELGDHRQLLAQGRLRFGRDAVGIARGGPFPGQLFQMRLGRGVGGNHLGGVFVGQLLQIEEAGVGHGAGRGDGMGPFGKELLHPGGGFQMPLAVRLQQVARLRKGRLLADAGHHVLQRAAVGGMVEHVVRGQQA